jgi:uncharacterized protein (TIGR02117 family)
LLSAGWSVAVLAALPLLYMLAALVGGLVPANAGWKQPRRGIMIFVETNGVHTWIVMPAVRPEMDWRWLAPARDIKQPSLAGDHVAIGYGNRDFYLNTPAWKDLTLRRALGAAFGNGPSLIHVYHERDPAPRADRRPIILTSAQYRHLAAYVAGSFAIGADLRTIPLTGRGYGASDVFYEARGRYNLFNTCNEWSGAALRKAGVRTGVWTPFSQSIMWRLALAA